MRFSTMIISALAVASLGVNAAPASEENTQEQGVQGRPGGPGGPGGNKCQNYCIFPKWDCDTGNVRGITQEKGVEDCAKDCYGNNECKLTVSNSGFCYPKTNDNAKWWNYNRNEKSYLAVEGKCEDLKRQCDSEPSWDKKKYHPDMFWGSYTKSICIPNRW